MLVKMVDNPEEMNQQEEDADVFLFPELKAIYT